MTALEPPKWAILMDIPEGVYLLDVKWVHKYKTNGNRAVELYKSDTHMRGDHATYSLEYFEAYSQVENRKLSA